MNGPLVKAGFELQPAVLDVAVGVNGHIDLRAAPRLDLPLRVRFLRAGRVRSEGVDRLEVEEARRQEDAVFRRLGVAAGRLVPEAVLDVDGRQTDAPAVAVRPLQRSLLKGRVVPVAKQQLERVVGLRVGRAALHADEELHRLIGLHDDVAVGRLDDADLRGGRPAAGGGCAEGAEDAAELAEERAEADAEEGDEEGDAAHRREAAGRPGAASADGLVGVGAGDGPGGALADRAADGRRQIRLAQIEPVDDAVLGVGNRPLQLAGREVRVDAPRQRQEHERGQVGRRRDQVNDQRGLADAGRQEQPAVEEGGGDGVGHRAGGEGEQGRGEVEGADALLSAAELALDAALVVGNGGGFLAAQIGRHRRTPWGTRHAAGTCAVLYLFRRSTPQGSFTTVTPAAASASPPRPLGSAAAAVAASRGRGSSPSGPATSGRRW